ncbi:MAG: hypothetical protein CVU48_05645 [Candidatus Cloacimonetes bacterium HGW-Cloacimonetes-1]|jgi:PAS domain S-box-containing protein|nr:MAG: hypothetical protein CVU48_05645 [Candidatus Cloacimonetes bacterium HGW-Cloacimonetes-1]
MKPIDLDPNLYQETKSQAYNRLLHLLAIVTAFAFILAMETVYPLNTVPFDVTILYVVTIGISVYVLERKGLFLNILAILIIQITRLAFAKYSVIHLVFDTIALNVLNLMLYKARIRMKNIMHQAQSDLAEIQIKEALINDSQKNYLRLFNSVENALWLVEQDWKIFYVNEMSRTLLGKSNKELVGKHIADFFAVESATEVENEFTKVLNGEFPNSKLKIQTLADDHRYFEHTVSHASWYNRSMFFIISHDITERLEAENQLNKSEDKFRKAFFSNPAIMAISRLDDGSYLDVNDSFTRTLGFTREEVIGHTASELQIIAGFKERKDYISMINDFGSLHHVEIPIRCKDGSIIEGSMYADTIEFSGQSSLLTVLLDVTEQKRLNTTLVNQSRMLYGLSYSSSQLLTTDDLDMGLQTALSIMGRAMLCDIVQILCFDESQAQFNLFKSWNSNTNDCEPDQTEHVLTLPEDMLEDLYHDRPITQLITGNITENDSTKSLMIIPIKSGAQLWGSLRIKYCSSERTWSKGDEVILIAFTNAIAGAIERNRSLEELRGSKAEAEAANRAKSSFLAMMSHEIRTPMNGIIGMSNLLKQMEMNAEMQDYVETIRISGDALLDLINDILDFSKIESGFLELDNRIFDLNACIEDVLELLSVKAAEKDIDLVFKQPQDIGCMIHGDSSRVRQILLNLIGNAIKFTETGQVKIEVNILEQIHQQTKLQVLISDTGIGISSEHLRKIFNPFAQAEVSTSRRYGGTGLGLSISQRLAEMMGGQIGVESTIGVGSVFSFTFETYFIYDQHLSIPDLSPIKNKTVFLHLLNQDSLEMVRQYLTDNGLNVYVINDLSSTLHFLEQNIRFDAGIVECSDTPQFSSIRVKALREVEGCELIPLIFVRTIGKKVLDLEQQEFHLNHFITKPLKIHSLANMLVSVIRDGSHETRSELNDSIDQCLWQTHPHTILVAEDNKINQKLIRNVLLRYGYDADVAANGQEVISAMKIRDYDLILMDIVMPVMNGIEATRLIRNMDLIIQPQIVAMTANVMDEDKKICIDAGMNDYLQKPLEFKELARILGRSK